MLLSHIYLKMIYSTKTSFQDIFTYTTLNCDLKKFFLFINNKLLFV